MPQRCDPSSPANRARAESVRLVKIGDATGRTESSAQFEFVAAHPAVISALVGPRWLDHLQAGLAAADGLVSHSAIERLVDPDVDLAAHEESDNPTRSTRRGVATPLKGTVVSPRFGILTAPMQVGYDDLVRVWREADAVPEIEHAWLFDHLLPIAGDPGGPIFEGWTTLSALAAQTSRLRLGLMVTSNRFRPPALLAKMATTVDVVSGGRLDFGIGVGSRPGHRLARREYEAHGLPFIETRDAVTSLAEACTVIRRLWTDTEPFDFDGAQVKLTGAYGNPKPVQRPHPPILIGGRAAATLRVVAEHANLWNIPGGDLDDVINRSALLDRYCTEIGRDPAEITRSIHLPVSYDDPAATRKAIAEAIDAGFDHLVLGLPAPFPEGVAQWIADELVR